MGFAELIGCGFRGAEQGIEMPNILLLAAANLWSPMNLCFVPGRFALGVPEAAFAVVERHIGITDAQVLRAERF